MFKLLTLYLPQRKERLFVTHQHDLRLQTDTYPNSDHLLATSHADTFVSQINGSRELFR